MSHNPIVQGWGTRAMRETRVHAGRSADPVAIKLGRREPNVSRPMSTVLGRVPQELVHRRVTDLGCRMVKLLPKTTPVRRVADARSNAERRFSSRSPPFGVRTWD
jgi:hypothetical protein